MHCGLGEGWVGAGFTWGVKVARISRILYRFLQKGGCYRRFGTRQTLSLGRFGRLISLAALATFGLASCSSPQAATTTPPTITNMAPTSGTVGTLVTVTGAYFGTTQGSSMVAINGTPATITSWGATSITFAVPAFLPNEGPGGTEAGNVVVTVDAVNSNVAAFTLYYAPGISGLSQYSGAAGTQVTITGINFGATQGTSTVTFNGTPATASAWSSTSITVTVPAGATTGNVVVTVMGAASNGVTFTVATQCCILSGTVSGTWAADVAIKISGPVNAVATTDENGNYSVANLPAGTYAVTPALEGYVYSPASAAVEIARNTRQNFEAAPATTSFSVSGTVSYAGAKSGTTFIRVYQSDCFPRCGAVAGTSIPLPNGSYTVRGLQPAGSNGNGTYIVNAEIDTQGTEERNASNPSGISSTVAITTANVSGINITVTDEAPPAPVTPDVLGVTAEGNAAVIRYTVPLDANGEEIATSYKVYTGTDVNASNGSAVSFAAKGGDTGGIIVSGLGSGAAYFKMAAVNSAGESATSGVVGPLVVGAPLGGGQAGAEDVSGGVALSQTATTREFATTTGYIVSNASGNIGAPAAATPWVSTNYEQGDNGEKYSLSFGIGPGTKVPVAATVFSGPNLAVPFDLGIDRNDNLRTPNFTVGAIPRVGDTYLFQVVFADGTIQVLSASVNAVLTASSVAQKLVMNSSAPYGATVPLLTWSVPAAPPASYTYVVGLHNQNGAAMNWSYSGGDGTGIPSSQTDVPFNVDGSASSPLLMPGSAYDWFVTVQDANGDSAQVHAVYASQ